MTKEELEKEAEDFTIKECCLTCSVKNPYSCKEKCECWTFATEGVKFGYSKVNEKYIERLGKAKEIIEELSKSLFLAKGIIRDLIDDTVDFKESKERAIYCYKQEKFDIYKEAVQFLKDVSE